MRNPGDGLSVTLDCLRAVSAQAVCVGHALSFYGITKGITLPLMQNVAVIVFFVLSGFLIGGLLIDRAGDKNYHLSTYLIDRFARIYSAYVPALILISVIDVCLVISVLHDYPQYVTASSFMKNVFMGQMYVGPLKQMISTNNFGSAGPLWTLAIEFHIYIFVGALFFVRKQPFLAGAVAVVFAWLPMHYLVWDVQPGLGTGLFSVWLCGLAIAAFGTHRIPAGVGLCIMVAGGLSIFATASKGAEYNPLAYAGVCVFLVGLISTSSAVRWGGAPRSAVSLFAGYSLSLYLVHYTIIYALTKVSPVGGLAGAAIGVIVSNVTACILASATEIHHKRLGAWIKLLRAHSSNVRA